MLKRPAAVPPFDPSRANMRLPDAALKFRVDNGLLSDDNLRRLNITAWLYRGKDGAEGIKVNPNTTIAELLAQFGPADTRDAEVGIHSEGRAAEFFRTNPDLQVLQIFTERIPCAAMCAPLLGNYFPGIPVFYYYDRRVWGGSKSATDILRGIYGGADATAQALAQLSDQWDRLNNMKNTTKGEHAMQLNLIRHSWNPMGRAVQAFNAVSTPELDIWDDVEASLNTARDLLLAKNVIKAGAFLMVARMQYLVAMRQFVRWKDGFEAAALKTYVAIGVTAVVAIAAAVGAFAVAAEAAGGASEIVTAEQTLARIRVASDQVDVFIRIASSEGEPLQIIEEAIRAARSIP